MIRTKTMVNLYPVKSRRPLPGCRQVSGIDGRSGSVIKSTICILALSICLVFAQPVPLLANNGNQAQEKLYVARLKPGHLSRPSGHQSRPLVIQEFRYHMPQAQQVSLVWGVDGWNVLLEEERPAGTRVRNGAMHTPMTRTDDSFVAQIQVRAGAQIDYGFLITRNTQGFSVNIWEPQNNPVIAENPGVIEVQTRLRLEGTHATLVHTEGPILTKEIRYRMPEAGKVYLVWGVDGWHAVPEEMRPEDTSVEDGIMHTPMIARGDVFVAKVQVPADTTVDFGFLITEKRNGNAIEPLWDSGSGTRSAGTKGSLIELETTLMLAQARELRTPLDLGLRLSIVICAILGAAVILCQAALQRRRRAAMLLLVSLTALGLGIRLYAALQWNESHPDSPERLVGDEPGYDGLARGMLEKLGFDWPGRVPLYPLWLAGVYLLTGGSYRAVPYVQAFLGVTTIPLTYLLGRKALGHSAGLVAALFAAVSYGLIHQSLHLLSEVLYTPVVLVAAITLWDAIDKPRLWRFCWAGFWVGTSSLVRPTLLLFPLVVVLLLVVLLKKQRAVRHWTVYVLAASLTIAPWILRNYALYHAVFPLQTSNAILWQGSPEYYHLIRDDGYTYEQVWKDILYGPGWQAHDPTSIEGDRWWTKRALASIYEEPITYFKYAIEKIALYWIGDINADWANTHVFNYQALRDSGFSQWDALLVMITRTLPILALLASFVLRRQWKTLLPIYALLIYTTLLHAATHAEARLSDPFQPFLLIIISGAIVQPLEKIGEWVSLPRQTSGLARRLESLAISRIILSSVLIAYALYAALFIYRTSFVVEGERFFSLFDDGMVSMRYARNLASGYGLVWNPGGERIEGFTNPMWVLYMSFFHLMGISTSKVSLCIQISAALFMIFNLYYVFQISRMLSRDLLVPTFALVLTAFYLPLNNWALQGMEVSILTLILSICVWKVLLCLTCGQFSVPLYPLLGLATLVRMDMVVPYVATLAFLSIADRDNRRKHLVVGLSILVSFAAIQSAFRVLYYGEILPNTYYLTMAGYPIALRVIRGLIVFAQFVFKMNFIIFLIPFLSVFYRKEKVILYMIFVLAAQILYSIYVGGDAWEWWGGSNRYIVIAMPVFFILLSYMLVEIVSLVDAGRVARQIKPGTTLRRLGSAKGTRQVTYATIVLAVICMLSINAIHGPEAFKEWLLINRPMLVLDNQYSVRMGLLLRRITTEQAKVAVVYAGAIPYFSDRYSIDLLGKADRTIAHEDMRISDWKYRGFYPGHLKWNYGYSIGELQPDVVAQLWDLWGSSKEARPYLEGAYMEVEIEGFTLYIRNESDNIRWSEIAAALNSQPHRTILG
jgi:hypothetical protein